MTPDILVSDFTSGLTAWDLEVPPSILQHYVRHYNGKKKSKSNKSSSTIANQSIFLSFLLQHPL